MHLYFNTAVITNYNSNYFLSSVPGFCSDKYKLAVGKVC